MDSISEVWSPARTTSLNNMAEQPPQPTRPTTPGLSQQPVVEVPTIDIGALVEFRRHLRRSSDESFSTDLDTSTNHEHDACDAAQTTAVEIDTACQHVGFFQIVGHQVPVELRAALRDVSEQFFKLTDEQKAVVSMDVGGRAWRGWFPVGQELTSGVPDSKEGYYFGTNLADDHPHVQAQIPLHGPNLYPDMITPAITVTYRGRSHTFGEIIELWMEHMAATADAVLIGMAMAFGLEPTWFDRWTAEPIELFRIFRYHPPTTPDSAGDSRTVAPKWGVGEHTDYGLLTMLVQDHTGGLEVRVNDRWVPAPPLDDAIVCNLGDMLERMTGGRYTSTTHRVQIPQTLRYSFPYFYDPGWFVEIAPIPGLAPTKRGMQQAAAGRWDGANIFDISGTYGEYLTNKVSRVFPELFAAVIQTERESKSDTETATRDQSGGTETGEVQ